MDTPNWKQLFFILIQLAVGSYFVIIVLYPKESFLPRPRYWNTSRIVIDEPSATAINNPVSKLEIDGKKDEGATAKEVVKVDEIRRVTEKVKRRYTPPFADNPNSQFRSPYHRIWKTNCSALFMNDDSVIHATEMMLKKARKNGKLPIPSDKSFTSYTQNCTTFKLNRMYPDKPNSDEEKNYPLAYIITTHKEVAQVERLLRAIYQPQNIYCIHPDKKSPTDYQVSIRSLVACFDNVFIVSKVESIQYAGFTRLQADINCMADLLQKSSVKWRYVINLCGQDFPLKTNVEIIHLLKVYKGINDILGIRQPWPYKSWRTNTRFVTNEGGKLVNTKEKKTPAPHNFTIYFGNAYYAATRGFVNYVINDQKAIDLLKWTEDTWSPDEHYWTTLQRYPGVPGGYPNRSHGGSIRFMRWVDHASLPKCVGKFVRTLCVFGVGYLQHILPQPHMFVNKFHYDFDPVTMQCLEEMLDYRQRYPDTIQNYVPGYPVTSNPN